MNLDDVPRIDSLEALELNVATVKEAGGELTPELITFVDDIYELASRIYMIVHKGDSFNPLVLVWKGQLISHPFLWKIYLLD